MTKPTSAIHPISPCPQPKTHQSSNLRISKPLAATSVQTIILAAFALNLARLFVLSCCGSPECRDVTRWSRDRSRCSRRFAVVVLLTKIMVDFFTLASVRRRMCRYCEIVSWGRREEREETTYFLFVHHVYEAVGLVEGVWYCERVEIDLWGLRM